MAGGTGSSSDLERMPAFMPDRLEAGTPNLPGIIGLGAALVWIEERGIDAIREHELALTGRLIGGLAELEDAGKVRVVGKKSLRVGLHCAPSAHRTLGTFPTGTIRFSVGWANTEDDVDAALAALREILA